MKDNLSTSSSSHNMANFEEKILAYLDGSLSEADRAEVLAAITGEHPSERALFDAHLRLQDLYSVVRKPVSAPLSVQRSLAAQLPVLAMTLPYLAAPAERRNRVAAGWFRSVRSSWVNASLLVAVLLLMGGVWYAVSNNSQHVVSSVTNTAVNIATGRSSNGGSSAIALDSSVRSASSTNVASSSSSSPHTSSSSLRSNVGAANTKRTERSNTTNSESNRSLASRSVALHSIGSTMEHSDKTTSAKHSNARDIAANQRSEQSAIKGNVVEGKAQAEKIHNDISNPALSKRNVRAIDKIPSTDDNFSSSLNASENGNPERSATNSTSEDLLPLPLHTVEVRELPVAIQQPSANRPFTMGTEENETYIPLRISLNSTVNVLLQRVPAMSSGLRDNRVSTVSNGTPLTGYDLGVEYEINPWLTLGLHGGNANFAHYQSFVYQPQLPGGTFLPEWYRETAISSKSSNWIGARIGYTVNPQSTFRYEFAATGGNVFSTSNSLLGKLELNLYYDIGSRAGLYLGAMLQAAQLSPLADSTISPVANSTIGIVNIGPQAQRTWFLTAGEQLGIILHL